MRASLVLVVATGCISAGGGITLNAGLDDAPVRRVGGSYEIGNLVEIVRDQLVGQLVYVHDLGPLGGRSDALDGWGARVVRTQGRGLPGLFLQGAYGTSDATQSSARLVTVGAGVAFVRHDAVLRGRTWTAMRAGLAYHRQHQLGTGDGADGHFLGIEIAIDMGFDLLGPMYD